MIIGAHTIIFSTNPEADRAFLRDILGLPHIDVGDGWLIFGLPPAEIAVHDSDKNDVHELYLMCHDVEALVAQLTSRDVETTPVQDQGWGLVTAVTLPSGGKLPIYQPRHERPEPMLPARKKAAKKKAAKKPAAKPAAKPTAKPAKKKAPPPPPAAKKKAGKKKAGKRR